MPSWAYSLIEKPHTDENYLTAWHYDHTQGRSVKGIDLITALYSSPQPDGEEVSLPVAFALVQKTEAYEDRKTGKAKRRDPVSKNERVQAMLRACVQNQLPFRYVLSDVWFASTQNMTLIKTTLGKDFVMPLKSNRKVALSEQDKMDGQYQVVSLARLLRIESVTLEQDAPQQIWLEQVSFPLLLFKQVFINKDGSQGVLYLVSSDLTLGGGQITRLYQRRWQVEVYHKSLKQMPRWPARPRGRCGRRATTSSAPSPPSS